ncbi:MAG: biosynthetic-type acetolactate synthase large subunit [Oscillospiraceae bacterium]|nr:biosynthetic-type acetolactate synthase large subunit [Oscillospiraceae bacterium]
MKKLLNGADIIVECLLEQGVDTVFGFPGGAVLNIYDSLYKYSDKINHVLTAHEQGAAHAADGYARASGKPGVVIATSGPGATNLVTGIATAYMDSVPMVAITGNVPLSLLGLDSFQEVDITGITMPITKHNYIVKDVNKLADTIREAFVIAQSGRPGPVLIDVPKDITAAMCEYSPKKSEKIEPVVVSEKDDFAFAVDMIKESKKPFIYTGGGVISSGASKELKEFVDLVDAPVSSSLMGQGGFDNFDDRYIGMLGMHGTKTSSLAVTECDLFVGIGIRFSDRVICNLATFAPNAKILQIDIDPAEINKNVTVSHRIIGDAKCVLEKLNKMIDKCDHKEWMEQNKAWKEQYKMFQKEDYKGMLTPQYVIETLCELTNGEAIISTEVGQHQMWAAQFYNFKNPRTFVSSGGLGTMGYGLGASLGAQVACPDKKVINIAGDGSFHMNCNELVTAYKHNIPIIELVFNNNVLGMVRQWQRLFYDKRFSQTTLDRQTDYQMLANAYGIEAYKITEKSQVKDVLSKALASNKPIFIECVIDKDINVLPMVPAGKSISDPILEIEIDDK